MRDTTRSGRKAAHPDELQTDTGRGTVQHNAMAALVTSRVFRSQVVKARKGKGSYQRKEKHKGRESCLIAA